MTKPKVNTSPVADKYTRPDERIIEYSSEHGGGLIAFINRDDRLRVELYRHDPAVDIVVSTDPMATGTKRPNVFRMLDASTWHLPRKLRQELRGIDGVIASEREYGWLLWVPEDIDEHLAGYGHGEIPESVIALWRYAQATDCQYILLDGDADVLSDLPTYN
jgi:hypothetical protein